jgi:hypothetical protein
MRRKPNITIEILKVVIGAVLAVPIGCLVVYAIKGSDPLGMTDYIKGAAKASQAIVEAIR